MKGYKIYLDIKNGGIMKEKIKLSESMEDYLEIILNLQEINKVARTKDIADRSGVKPSSVTGALKTLEEKKMINYAPYRFITLTAKGTKIAKEITRRHTILKDFLLKALQVDADTADATACRMEHVIDPISMERLVCFINYIYTCPRCGADWLQSFTEHCSSSEHDWEKCNLCLEKCKTKHQTKKKNNLREINEK